VTIWVKNKIFAKGLESLHVVFNVIEKHGPVKYPLVGCGPFAKRCQHQNLECENWF